MFKKALLTFLTLVGLTTFGANAHALTLTCTVDQVYFDSNRMIVSCVGNSNLYYAFLNAPGCSTASVDTLKTWTSMLSAQLLSGKPAELNYNAATSTCGSPTVISVKMRLR